MWAGHTYLTSHQKSVIVTFDFSQSHIICQQKLQSVYQPHPQTSRCFQLLLNIYYQLQPIMSYSTQMRSSCMKTPEATEFRDTSTHRAVSLVPPTRATTMQKVNSHRLQSLLGDTSTVIGRCPGHVTGPNIPSLSPATICRRLIQYITCFYAAS